MQRLLTRGIGHNKFKKTEIGEIPETWTTIKLNDVVKLSSGKPRPKDFIPEYGRDSIYPIYGGNGILGYSSKFNFENKTIILGRVGEYCGVVHRNDGKCWISDNALYIKELKYSFFDLQFLALSLEYKDLNRYKSQSGQPLISQRVLYNLQLALPPIDEQKKISAIISEITSMLENEQSHKAELEQIKKGLMQVLLTGKLRVAV
jgi:type I restriction enzyme S subunit